MRPQIEFRLMMLKLVVRGDRAIDAVKWPLAAILLAFALALGAIALRY